MVNNIYDLGNIITFSDNTQMLVRGLSILPNPSTDYPTTVLQDEVSLPLKTFQVYGNHKPWYLIADYNNIINPFEDTFPGMNLVVPNLL